MKKKLIDQCPQIAIINEALDNRDLESDILNHLETCHICQAYFSFNISLRKELEDYHISMPDDSALKATYTSIESKLDTLISQPSFIEKLFKVLTRRVVWVGATSAAMAIFLVVLFYGFYSAKVKEPDTAETIFKKISQPRVSGDPSAVLAAHISLITGECMGPTGIPLDIGKNPLQMSSIKTMASAICATTIPHRTTILMLPDSEVVFEKVSAARLEIRLVRGEAIIKTIKDDPQFTLSILAGREMITSRGTLFSVIRHQKNIRVQLYKGKVAIFSLDSHKERLTLVEKGVWHNRKAFKPEKRLSAADIKTVDSLLGELTLSKKAAIKEEKSVRLDIDGIQVLLSRTLPESVGRDQLKALLTHALPERSEKDVKKEPPPRPDRDKPDRSGQKPFVSRDYFRQAAERFLNKDFTGAKKLLILFLNQGSPDTARMGEAYTLLADCHKNLRAFGEAVKAYQFISHHFPRLQPMAVYEMGKLYLEGNNAKKALDHFNHLLTMPKASPYHELAEYYIIKIALIQKEYPLVSTRIEAFVQKYPQNPNRPYLNLMLGTVYEDHLRDLAKAQKVYRTILTGRYPADIREQVMMRLIHIYLKLKQVPLAKDLMKQYRGEFKNSRFVSKIQALEKSLPK